MQVFSSIWCNFTLQKLDIYTPNFFLLRDNSAKEDTQLEQLPISIIVIIVVVVIVELLITCDLIYFSNISQNIDTNILLMQWNWTMHGAIKYGLSDKVVFIIYIVLTLFSTSNLHYGLGLPNVDRATISPSTKQT